MILKITINDHEYEVSDDATVLQTCLKLGVSIPHLCYLKGYEPEGICGLCVVEIDGENYRLSCLTHIRDGMRIKTDTKKLTNIRKANIDRILESHNINCLNCHKNGNCDLQKYAAQIYEKAGNTNTLAAKNKISKMGKLADFIYDGSKCIKCNRCVKFLNKFCQAGINGIESLDSIDENSDISLNAVEFCPTAALEYEQYNRPEFLMNRIETYDINDVFTPKLAIFERDNEIIKTKAVADTYITNEIRKSLKQIPKRVHNEDDYRQVIDSLSEKLKSTTHEKNIFVVGDNLDIVSLFYIKALAAKFSNVCIVMNDCQFPDGSGFQIGLIKSELPLMDFAIFLGDFSETRRCHITSCSSRIKKDISISFSDLDNFFDNHEEDFATYSNPILFVSIDEFKKNTPEITVQKLKGFADQYIEKYGKNVEIRVIPENLSQMLLPAVPERLSLNIFHEKFNKHDLNFICVVGDLNCDLNSEEIFTVYHSVYEKEGAKYIPSKHFTEDATYHVDIFNKIIKTTKVIHNDLKSNREFLFDLMANVLGDDFEDINDDIHSSIRKTFFG